MGKSNCRQWGSLIVADQLILSRILNRLSYLLPDRASLRPWLHSVRGPHIGRGVWISQLVYIDEIHTEAVTIGDNCTIGLRASIIAHLYWGSRQPSASTPVTIGKDVFVGPHCLILPGANIGARAVIKGGSVVKRLPRGLYKKETKGADEALQQMA